MIRQREITPELLARLTALLFTKLPFQDILRGDIHYSSISSGSMAELMIENAYFHQSYSKLECASYAQTVIDYVAEKSAWQNEHTVSQQAAAQELNAFDLLLMTLQDLLVVNNNQLMCSYEHILSWRLLSRHLGEELPLSARYASWDRQRWMGDRRSFDWPYITGHNNKQLNVILHRGIAEHHCHLWGSTPYFHVSWVNLMNSPSNSDYSRNLHRLDPRVWAQARLSGSKENAPGALHEDFLKAGEPWSRMGELAQLRAAWIRFYLIQRLTGAENWEPSKRIVCDAVCKLENWPQLLLSKDMLQAHIDACAYTPRFQEDYALNLFQWDLPAAASNYKILMGERWFYYNIFADYFRPESQKKLSSFDYNLFFAYCLIRAGLRAQMVQSNDRIGFDNFSEIERRKGYFLGDSLSERRLTRLAINETLKKPYIQELEVRITPSIAQLKRLEAAVNQGENKEEDPRQSKARKRQYYYTFHFIKQKDTPTAAQRDYGVLQSLTCRNDKLRRKLKKQALQILHFRKTEPQLARRLLGIDAASQEIGCRPEVFATVYRLLGGDFVQYGGYPEDLQLPPLGKTYHVGEDFLDIVDGLRAIDEVIRFLDFDCGDRMGHAIALGINVEAWYENKHRTISLSVQDYLDNLAWFYHALNYFSVPGMHALKERLSADFEYWFRIVYRNHTSDEALNSFMERARRDCYDKTGEDHGRYRKHTCHFDIMDYYHAWSLRGDDPSCYAEGYFRKPDITSFLLPMDSCKVNEKFPARYEDRYVAEYSLLNYLYQFDEAVRREGEKRISIHISEEYIRGVKAVQLEMRYLLAQKGIAIETNPTSNVLISNFRKYEEHPVLAFYNRGLPVSEEEEAECAQLQVSVNTDDSGVFYTDLETEYALLARSLELITGENGRPRFKKSDIYTWIDHIRVMGLEQSFRPIDQWLYPSNHRRKASSVLTARSAAKKCFCLRGKPLQI